MAVESTHQYPALGAGIRLRPSPPHKRCVTEGPSWASSPESQAIAHQGMTASLVSRLSLRVIPAVGFARAVRWIPSCIRRSGSAVTCDSLQQQGSVFQNYTFT